VHEHANGRRLRTRHALNGARTTRDDTTTTRDLRASPTCCAQVESHGSEGATGLCARGRQRVDEGVDEAHFATTADGETSLRRGYCAGVAQGPSRITQATQAVQTSYARSPRWLAAPAGRVELAAAWRPLGRLVGPTCNGAKL
jgi:hypothetical protein